MAPKLPLYWNPSSHLNAAYSLRHQAPQLVGRLPRRVSLQHSLRAAAKVARHAQKLPKGPKVKGAVLPRLKSGLMGGAAKSVMTPGLPQKPPPGPVPRLGGPLSNQPPAGESLPSLNPPKLPSLANASGGLAATPPVPLGSKPGALPGLP